MSRDSHAPKFSEIFPPVDATRESAREEMLYESDAGKEREDSIETPLADIDIITSRGGDQSKTKLNEDAYVVIRTAEQTIVLIMDGVGGHGGGIEPARISRAAFHTYIAEHRDGTTSTRDALAFIGAALHHRNIVDTEPKRRSNPYGVAAVMVAISNNKVVDVSWSGDCKLLTVRDGKKFPEGTTLMHNLAAEIEDNDDDFLWNPCRHILTRFLGNDPDMNNGRSDRLRFPGKAGDQIVVASDGLWDVVTETEVEALARKYRGQQLHLQLFALAHSRNNAAGEQFEVTRADGSTMPHTTPEGGGDNITIAVIELK